MAFTMVERDIEAGLADPTCSFDAAPPLVVDLDGTCVKTNLLLEFVLALLHESPRYFFLLPGWWMRGKAYFALEVARRASLDISLLPYRMEFLDYLKKQRSRGRSLVVATATNGQIARQVADYLMVFDSILSNDGSKTLSSNSQRDRLVRKFGEGGFDYATSGSSGLTIASSARKVILVHPSRSAQVAVPRVAEVDRIFADRQSRFMDYLAPLRPQHWLKNLLAFAPVFAAHRFYEISLLEKSLIAFASLCCCASSGYLFNDLFDLAADRHHPRKRLRPFAAGDLQLSFALVMIPGLVLLGCVAGSFVSLSFVGMLLGYFVLTLTYSLYIKRVVVLDVIVLAGLYTFRIMAGSAAVDIWPSPWLLAFSTFLFLSLALVKRYSELIIMRKVDGDAAKARSYELGDAELLAANGTASSYLAVFVLALYITSGPANSLYGRHQVIWFLCPLLLYWIGRMWLMAHRGRLPDDPVVFAAKDSTSRILILLMLGTAILAL
jgi:4-hydroxybenzoate polyprenyltransferase